MSSERTRASLNCLSLTLIPHSNRSIFDSLWNGDWSFLMTELCLLSFDERNHVHDEKRLTSWARRCLFPIASRFSGSEENYISPDISITTHWFRPVTRDVSELYSRSMHTWWWKIRKQVVLGEHFSIFFLLILRFISSRLKLQMSMCENVHFTSFASKINVHSLHVSTPMLTFHCDSLFHANLHWFIECGVVKSRRIVTGRTTV